MHSQDRILVLPVTKIGMPGRFLQRIIFIATAILILTQYSYAQCPPDMEDTTAPTCQDDPVITINLDPGQCQRFESIPSQLLEAFVSDNCDPSPLIQIKSQPAFTNPFDIGMYEILYIVEDVDRNFTECFFKLIIEQAKPDNLHCTGSINHSLDPATCSGSITLADVLGTNDVSCADECVVTIMDEYGSPLPNEFDLDDINKTFQYQLCCGGVCCWGYVNVQYYGAPSFVCDQANTEIMSSCIEMDMIPPPTVTSQCVTPDIVLISQIENVQSCDSDIQKEIIRTYQIVTAQGPIDQTCEQTISIQAADLSNIEYPAKTVIGCMEDADPSNTGGPEYCVTLPAMGAQGPIDTCFVLIDGGLPLNCSVFVSYEDSSFDTPCGEMISRLWHVVQWTCSVEEHETFVQIIEISDVEPPEIDCPSSLSFNTNTVNCEAAVTLPSITATDDCGNDLSFAISTPGGVVRENGGIVVLPVGEYDIVYRVSDCANTTQCTVPVTVSDLTPPVAICETSLKIGFGEIGGTFLQAYKLNGGSYDDCDSVSYQVARMDDTLRIEDHPYADQILIECSDVDTTFMVILETSDQGGNVSYCMVSVCVVDNIDGRLVCPPDAVVDCDTIFDPANLNVFFGEFLIEDNCPDRNTVQDELFGELNDCRVGELRRRIRLFNGTGVFISQCIQTITFEPLDTLSIEDVIAACPKPVGPIEMCDFPDLAEDVELETASCQLLGFNMTIDTLNAEEIQQAGILSCMAVERCWKFIDWCKDEGVFSKSQPFIKCDTVELIDAIDPVIIGLPSTAETVCFFSASCDDEANLNYPTVNVQTDCSGIDSTSYTIVDADNMVVDSGEGLAINVNVTAGTYTITWYAEDFCGNSSEEMRVVVVENCKGPTLSCLAGLVVPLVLNSGGFPRANVETKQLVAAAFHPCGYEVITSFSEATFTSTQIQQFRTFTCNQVGEPVEVEVYAIDENNRVSHCTTMVSVSDNGLCSSNFTDGPFAVAGQISTSANKMISDVMVKIEGERNEFNMTNYEGFYGFRDMPMGGDYLIQPSKTDDFLNGVSMLDLIRIQQHVLNLNSLTDPYLLLAADVNQSGTVNIADLILLQRILLGSIVKPSDDQSWMFIDADHKFIDDRNPFDTYMPHTAFINNLSKDMEHDFIGVKYGDVDGNALTNVEEVESRNSQSLSLMYDDIYLDAGSDYIIPFYTKQSLDLRGVQFELFHSGITITDMRSTVLELENAIHITDTNSSLYLPMATGKAIAAENELLSIHIHSNYSGWLKDVIGLNNDQIQSLFIHSDKMEMNDIDLVSNGQQLNTTFEILQIKPNPWSDYTSIEYYLHTDNNINILITNLHGQQVYRQSAFQTAGLNRLEITHDILPHPGVYLIHIDNGNTTATKKMIKLE